MSRIASPDDTRASYLVRRVFVASFFSEIRSPNLGWISERIAAAATPMRVSSGTVLYRQGEPPTHHYFVVEGAVRLEAAGAPPLTFEAPSLIGTFDHLGHRPYARSAIVTSTAHLLRVDAKDWDELLEDSFDLKRTVIAFLAGSISGLRIELGGIAIAGADGGADGSSGVRVDGPPLGLFDRVVALESIPAFATEDVQALVALATLAEEVVLVPGEAVSVRGEKDDRLALVLAGAVEGTRAPGAPVESYGPGSMVFGASALCTASTAFEARAVAPTRLLTLEREDHLDVLEEHFGLARATMRALMLEREALVNEQARRLDETDT